ncbi:MAG: TRAM domain-containing protein [Candidatus Ratteibacteria bacterium]
MGVYIIRAFFILLTTFAGYLYWSDKRIVGVLGGLIGSIVIVGIEWLLGRVPFKKLVLAISGLLLGLLTAILVANFILLVPFETVREENGVRFILYVMFSYLGVMIGIKSVGELGFIFPYLHQVKGDYQKMIIIDSSVAIDGRIHDLMVSGFVEGTLLIPSFVTQELQELADSAGEMKRQRGRRGLESLNKMRNDSTIDVKFYDMDFPEIEGVDAKLVKLASTVGAKILTNDFNLTKVAEVQDIKVLNLNTLANLLRPRLMAGEMINLKVVKEGKEYGQGIGYLEDGTMVVIEEGASHIGKTVEMIIDSTIQTASGRIIFAKIK